MGKLTVTLAPGIILPQNVSMKRDVALAKLRPFEDRLRARGIRALYLFGSTARDESRETSDLDLLFDRVEFAATKLEQLRRALIGRQELVQRQLT